jgi:hypothetical protein
MQKLLQSANRLPQSAGTLRGFSQSCPRVKSGLEASRRELKAYIKDLTLL